MADDTFERASEVAKNTHGFNAEDWIAWASLTGPIREAIYMSDHGQDCVCSEQGECWMHAQQKRAEAALETLRSIWLHAREARKAAKYRDALWQIAHNVPEYADGDDESFAEWARSFASAALECREA